MNRLNVLEYLDDAMLLNPDKTAYADESEELTFRQLQYIVQRIGSFISKKGYTREPVLIFMDKSVREIAAFLGVVAAGCFYVPLDAEMPTARLRHIVENTKAGICITDTANEEKARGLGGDIAVFCYEEACACKADTVALSVIREKSLDTDPIYIVFTSGSTGIPKGVAACHRSVIDYIEQLSEVLQFSEDTVFGNQAPLYFDACLKELYPTLKFGATTWLIPKELFSLPIRLVEYLNEHRINTICWVVSALTIVSAFRTFKSIKPQYLRTVAFGSEVFPVKQFRLWKEACPEGTVFVNLYGPTEATGMSCYYRVDREFADDEAIPVGRPFRNTEVILLKDDRTRAQDGEEGEICLRGTCVTLGYYNDPERTAQAFIQNPLQSAWEEKIYCTGDIGRIGPDGNLYFVSRKDSQIKHMGHRIELGEIEVSAAQADGVILTGCVYDRDKKRILLYYTGEIQEKELIVRLKEMLPPYMLPHTVRRIAEMPRLQNGKIDRKTLREEYLNAQKGENSKNG